MLKRNPNNPQSTQPKITIGILGLTFGPSTYSRYHKRLVQIENQLNTHLTQVKNNSIQEADLQAIISTFLSENDFIFHQNLDLETPRTNHSPEEVLRIVKQHRIHFEKKGVYLNGKGSQTSLKANQGNQYLYYSTAYAKMLFGWNQFDLVIPDSQHPEMFQKVWNKYVRTVPIDHTIGSEDPKRTKLRKIIQKLDGVIFTGGNSSFYAGIDTKNLSGDLKKMSQEDLMEMFINQARKRRTKDKQKDILERTKTTYFQGLDTVLQIVKEINRTPKPKQKKIPILAICLGFEGLLLSAGDADMRLGFVSDSLMYHDIYPVFSPLKCLPNNDCSSLPAFIQNYYKNPNYFRKLERNCYFYHTKMISQENFYCDSNLRKEYEIVAVSYADDKGIGNLTFKDMGSDGDWTGPQAKELVVFPMNSEKIEAKIQNNQKLFFSRKSSENKVKPDLRLQQKKDIALIYKIIDLLKSKLDKGVSKEIEQNYKQFIAEADEYLDMKLKRKNKLSHMRKLINTDYRDSKQEYISIIEGKNDPIYGIQYHVEKSMYNFYKNPAVKNGFVPRSKDQLFVKFFLQKVFEEKIKSLKIQEQINPNDNSISKSIEALDYVAKCSFAPDKLVPHVNKKCNKNNKFDYKWLFKGIIPKEDEKGNVIGQEYDMNSPYNNNLSQQILRDYDEFYQELEDEEISKKRLGLGERFVLRKINSDSEVLVFKRLDFVDSSYGNEYVRKSDK
jgi:anthranilate/para-aminobenzoate synthase component II